MSTLSLAQFMRQEIARAYESREFVEMKQQFLENLDEDRELWMAKFHLAYVMFSILVAVGQDAIPEDNKIRQAFSVYLSIWLDKGDDKNMMQEAQLIVGEVRRVLDERGADELPAYARELMGAINALRAETEVEPAEAWELPEVTEEAILAQVQQNPDFWLNLSKKQLKGVDKRYGKVIKQLKKEQEDMAGAGYLIGGEVSLEEQLAALQRRVGAVM